MGSYGYYSGNNNIAEEKRNEFTERVIKILGYGGMMEFDEEVRLFGKEISLLKPVRLEGNEDIHVHYNYFEDDFWEDVYYDPQEAWFDTEKIGSAEYCAVVTAVYMLYELYDDMAGCTWSDSEAAGSEYVGWINHLFGTSYSMEKRFRIWEYMEKFTRVSDDYRKLGFIPSELTFLAGGTELADVFYIKNGTSTLTPDTVRIGTYPYDVYSCKSAIQKYLETSTEKNGIPVIWDLIKMDKGQRATVEDSALQEIAAYSFILPARVIVYLSAELTDKDFWDCWKVLKDEVYHDEKMKQYESDEVKKTRMELRRAPIAPVKTADFLRIDYPAFFYHTPEELKGKPKYMLTDDDRLYWWDGTDEVVISESMDNWLKELAQRHRDIMKNYPCPTDSSIDFLESFINLIADTNEYYKRIYLFGDMFYEFLKNCNKKEYIAAIELFRILVEENKEDGKIIERMKYSWTMTSRNVTHNIGRLRVKRYLSVMANPVLRKSYFGF